MNGLITEIFSIIMVMHKIKFTFCFTGKFLYNDFLSDIIRKDSIIYDTSLKNQIWDTFFIPQNIAEDAWELNFIVF
jgi:hypothetical protein